MQGESRSALLLAVTIVALAVAARPGDPEPPPPTRAAAPAEPLDQAGRTATPSPWIPQGAWGAIHAPRTNPLWTTGKITRARPCGLEERTGPERRGVVPPLCAVHGARRADGTWTGWAVGEEGLLARYADGRWRKVDDLSPNQTTPMTYHLYDVFVVAEEDVWAVGWAEGDRTCADCGVVLHYDGRAWRRLDKFEFGVNACVPPLNAIDMHEDPEGRWFGWIVGDTQRCLNGGAIVLGYDGAAWKWFRAPQLSINMHDVRIVSRQEAWAVGDLGSESYFDALDGRTGDWPLQGRSGAHDLFAVDLVDPTYGWDGGIIGRLNRYDGNCHDDDPGGTPCWFDNQANPIRNKRDDKVTNSVYAIDMLSRTQGWLTGAQDSRISMIAHFYEDARWLAVPVADDPGKSLYDLHMLDAGHGFAVGDEGVIVEYVDDGIGVPSVTPTPSGPPASGTPTSTSSPTLAPAPSPTASATTPTAPTSTRPPPSPSPSATATVTPTVGATRSPTRAATASPSRAPTTRAAYLPVAIQSRPRR